MVTSGWGALESNKDREQGSDDRGRGGRGSRGENCTRGAVKLHNIAEEKLS